MYSFHDIMEIQDTQDTHLILACLIPWVFIATVLFSVCPSRGSTEAPRAKQGPCIDEGTQYKQHMLYFHESQDLGLRCCAEILEFHPEGSDVLLFKSSNIWIRICPSFGEDHPL